MPTEAARRNHDALFGDQESALTATDPELIELFDNFAFDEVLAHDDLPVRTRLLTQLASMIAVQALAEFKIMVGAALTAGISPVEVKEVVYQAVPYVGMARTFDFLHATNDVLRERGVELPLAGQSPTNRDTRFEDGMTVQKKVVGHAAVEAMHANARDDEKHIQRYLSANCFGDYLTRAGIELPIRELLTFAMLASLGGCEPQLAGHVRGNLNVGNTREALLNVLTQLIPYIGYPLTLNALRVLDEITLEKK